MTWDPDDRPLLRPVEPFALPPSASDNDAGQRWIGLRDPSGLSDVVLAMSASALALMALMDGEHSCEEIRAEFLIRHGQRVSTQTLVAMLTHLREAHFLQGDHFEAFYQQRLAAYREQGVRRTPCAETLGLAADAGPLFDGILQGAASPSLDREPIGLIAPHLDYPRGAPCYAAAYGALCGRRTPDRVVILGTNHFGLSTSVVATGNDFETPLGTTRTDVEFLAKLEASCGDLRRYELDHAHEHSVELQVAFLQHLFGATTLTIVPLLCPDPCQPADGASPSRSRENLRDFSSMLQEIVRDDPADTLLVAGADLSHVGRSFGDRRELDEAMLEEVRRRDACALDGLLERGSEQFVASVAKENNPTRVCSAGCISVLASVLADATPHLLGYHQAVDSKTQTCVTCAALAYT